MKQILVKKRDADLIKKAINRTVSELQYERHQALSHGCTGETFSSEIEEYRILKEKLFGDEGIQDR